MRFGTVGIIGRTNVGKSTFLNAALGEKVAIVSPLPQTTRDEVLGVVHREDAQIAFTDTPGLHRPRTELGRRMNAKALDTARSHDLVVFVTDVYRLKKVPASKWRPDTDPIHPDDRRLLSVLQPEIPCLLVVNKVDQIKDKARLLPLISAFEEAHNFAAIMPSTMLKPKSVERILDEIVKHLPEQEARYDKDTLTDKGTSFFVREFVREQVLLQTHREVPHAVAVSIDRFEENDKLAVIHATIHIEKTGQRAILVGKGGSKIKAIGTAAREALEVLIDKKIHLELFVRVTERWKDMPRQLHELGYDASGSRSLHHVLPQTKKKKRLAPPKKRAQKPRTSQARTGTSQARTGTSNNSEQPRSSTPKPAPSASPAPKRPAGPKRRSGQQKKRKPRVGKTDTKKA